MEPRPRPPLAIARIEGGGTAFAIAEDLVLTAFHLVREAGDSLPRLRFDGGPWVPTVVERIDEAADVALLRLTTPGLTAPMVTFGLSTSVRSRQAWRARGYPEVLTEPTTIFGTVVDPNARLRGSDSAIQLNCIQASSAAPLPLAGFSGSPVIDDDSNLVIGLVRLGMMSPDAPHGTVGGDVYATSVAHMVSRWPDLLEPLVRQQRVHLRAALGDVLVHDLSQSGELPLVSELEAHKVGAQPTRYSEEGRAPYVRRPGADARLAELLRRECVLLVSGPSGAGKSRTAFQALAVSFPDAGFAQPLPGNQALRKLMQLDREEPLCVGPLVVWLDDLDEYLRQDAGLSPAIVEWLEQRARGGRVVATIREDRYQEVRGSTGGLGKAALLFLDRAERGQFALGHQVQPEEAGQAAQLYPAEDFSDRQIGIGLRLLAGPELIRELRAAESTNPSGWAVIKAAADYSSMGLPAPIPDAVLRQLFRIAARDHFREPKTAQSDYRDGVRWACRPAASGVALLTQHQGRTLSGKICFELLDHVQEFASRQGWLVPDEAWPVAISAAETSDLLALSAAAEARDLVDVAIAALRAATRGGSSQATLELGALLAQSGDLAEGKEWIGKAIDAGERKAFTAMGAALFAEGSVDEAKEWLWQGIEAGDSEAAFVMGQIQAGAGQFDEALYWLQIASEEGNGLAWLELAEVYREMDQEDAATASLENGASGDGLSAALCRHQLASDRGDSEQAEQWLRVAAELGDLTASRVLGMTLADRGEVSAAEHWLRRGARRDPEAAFCLGLLAADMGEQTEAQHWLLEAYQQGVGAAAVTLAELALVQGKASESAQWLRAAVDSANVAPEAVPPVAADLAEALELEGRHREAVRWMEDAASAGYVPAIAWLADEAMDEDEWDTAERRYLEAAQAGYPDAAFRLAGLLEDRGELRRAALWLRAALEAKLPAGPPDPAVAARLGSLFRSLGDLAEAERWLILAAEQDSPGAADQVEALHAQSAMSAAARHDPDPPGTSAMLAEGIEAEGNGDYATAVRRYRDAAVNGNVEASFRYAKRLQAEGEDEASPNNFALHWMRKAAEGGHLEAAADLVFLATDPLERLHWLNVAEVGGHPGILRNIADLRYAAGQSEEAEPYFRRSAKAGNLAAANALGALLVARDETADAITWFTRAARGGIPEAAHNLGALAINHGRRPEALRWFRQAAEAGSVVDMLILGTGFVAEEGEEQAQAWLARAFDHGSGEAAVQLALRVLLQHDRASALQWARSAGELGDPNGAFLAGRFCYDEGELAEAEKWYRVAAEAGMAEAAIRLAVLVARRGDLRGAELLLAAPVREGQPLALASVADLSYRRSWMTVAETLFSAAADCGHLFAALDAACLAEIRGSQQTKARWLKQWQSTQSMSAMAFRNERDYHRTGVTIYRLYPWEPAQPATYQLDGLVMAITVNAESGLELPFHTD